MLVSRKLREISTIFQFYRLALLCCLLCDSPLGFLSFSVVESVISVDGEIGGIVIVVGMPYEWSNELFSCVVVS